MCKVCKPFTKYENIQSHQQLDRIKLEALNYVAQGLLQITYEYTDSNQYQETQFYCTECGCKHILWLHTQFLASGGEWRTLSHQIA